jgi:NAD-dependent deacetylase
VNDIATVRGWLEDARAVAVLTGAGISTDSGIPDFRGPQGIWTRDPAAQRMSTLSAYVERPRVAGAVVAEPARRMPPGRPSRTPDIERSSSSNAAGKLSAILTQNIDGLHQKAGSSPDKVLELHGTLWEASA